MLQFAEDCAAFSWLLNTNTVAMTVAPPGLNMLSRLLSLLIRLTIVALLVGVYFATTSPAATAQDASPAGATTPDAAAPAAPLATASSTPPITPPTPTRFEHLSLEDGLSQNAVLDLLQDRDGFLWVATQDGLNRYDGYGFTVFKNDPDDPTTLSHNSVLQLLQDSNGAIWAGTWGGGLNRLDPQTGKITRYMHKAGDPTSLSNDTVAALWEDRHGSIWVGSMGGGLSRLDRVSGQFTHFRHKEGDPDSISSDFVSTLYEDADGKLWLGTGGFGADGAGVDRFDPVNETFTHFRHDPTDPNSLSSDTISTVFPDGNGKLWVGTGGFSLSGHGLNLLDPASGQVTRYKHDEADPTSIASDTILSVYTDGQGQTWVGTWGGGSGSAAARRRQGHLCASPQRSLPGQQPQRRHCLADPRGQLGRAVGGDG